MSNTQLLLSIGIPSVLVILAWLSNNTRFSALESRLDGRITGLETRLDARINDLATRQDAMAEAHHRDFVELLRAMTTLHERVAKVEERQK